MKKEKILVITLMLTMLSLLFTRAVLSNTISTHGIELSEYENDIEELKKKNAVLKEEVLVKSSFTHIDKVASTSGFVASKAPFVISNSVPIARKQ